MVGTRNVIDLCMERSAKLVFASSSEIYGELERDPLVEDHDQLPLRPANDYAISKWAERAPDPQLREGWTRVRPVPVLQRVRSRGYLPRLSKRGRAVLQPRVARAPVDRLRRLLRVFMYVDDFIPRRSHASPTGSPRASCTTSAAPTSARCASSATWCSSTPGPIRAWSPTCPRTSTMSRAVLHQQGGGGPGSDDPTILLEEGVPRYIEWLRTQEMGAGTSVEQREQIRAERPPA